jgi:hypothetical protein
MSGGAFDYLQYKFNEVASGIEDEINRNSLEPDKYGWSGHNFSKRTIAKFKEGADLCRQAAIFAQRIDWLVSGDDSEESFHKRLNEDLGKLNLLNFERSKK